MTWLQREVTLPPFRRGFHLITDAIVEAVPEIRRCQTGLVHLFLLHTSASLTVNENADPDVRADLESAMNRLAPEDAPYVHTVEGPDDMPAHVKNSLLGSSLTIPVHSGRLRLGTWQGVYLCEHRNRPSRRHLVITLHGQFSEGEERP